MGFLNKALGLLGLASAPAPQAEQVTLLRDYVRVPAGHVLPLGETIKQPFNVMVESAVRWHPDWDEPRITVNVWRKLPMGDALGWSGKKALMFKALLPEAAVAMADAHGEPASAHMDLVRQFNLAVPAAREPLASFILS